MNRPAAWQQEPGSMWTSRSDWSMTPGAPHSGDVILALGVAY